MRYLSNAFKLSSVNENVQTAAAMNAKLQAEWTTSAFSAASKIHGDGPFDEDELEKRLSPIFKAKLDELDGMSLGEDVLQQLRIQLDSVYKEQEKTNEAASVKFNEALADRIIQQCTLDTRLCREEATAVQSGDKTTTNVHGVYHRFYKDADYFNRFLKEKRGTIDSAIPPSVRVQAQEKSLIAQLREDIFGAAFIEKQVRESRLGVTTRHCPACNVAWEREAGCQNVRCGHSNFTSGERVMRPPAARTGAVHGCGTHFDWNTAQNVSTAEERSFWHKCPQTIEAERLEELKRLELLKCLGDKLEREKEESAAVRAAGHAKAKGRVPAVSRMWSSFWSSSPSRPRAQPASSWRGLASPNAALHW